MANKKFPQPPKGIEKASDGPLQNLQKKQWFNEVYRRLSEENHQTITAAGAVNPDAEYVDVSTTGSAFAITLEAPTVPGKRMMIEMTADSGHNVTMSLTNCVNGSASTTCTWNDVNDALILISGSAKWQIVAENGVSLT